MIRSTLNKTRLPFIISFLIAGTVLFSGCGGGTLIPRDLKDYVSAKLPTPRRNVDVIQPFRTTILLLIERGDINKAREAERDLITKCVEYFQRDNITNFINDTVLFKVRLASDADTYLNYSSHYQELLSLIRDDITLDSYIERCYKDEKWYGGEE